VIADWFAQWPAFVASFVVLFGPGLLIGRGLRLRGLVLWALAPVGSTAVIGGLAIVYGALHVPWNVWTALVGCLAIAVIVWVAGIALGPRRPAPPRDRRALVLLAGGLAIGIAFVVARFVTYVHDPDAISQTNDAVFHLNALRYILETANGSSMHISGVIGATGFYPAAWHDLASLVAIATGCSIPVAANAVALMVSAAVWPLGLAWFAREVSRGSAAVTALSAALSASLWAFPMLLLEWGIVYPYALSVALLPAAAAIVVAAPRWIAGEGPVLTPLRSGILSAVLVIAALAALGLAQPATILAWGLVAMTFTSWWFGLHVRSLHGRMRGLLIAGFCVAWIVFAGVWVLLTRSTTGSHWPPFRPKLVTVVDVLFNGQVLLPYAVSVSILMIIGLVVSIRRRTLRWLATAWAAFSVLYAVTASLGQPFVRGLLTGAWYSDPYRLAALAPLTVIPLAAVGLAAVATWATAAISGRSGRSAATVATAWSLLAVAVVGAIAFAVRPAIQMPAVTEGTADGESRYVTEDYLSPDERTLLERLPEHTPADALIIGNPSTGMGFGYMLSGRNVYPRTWQPSRAPQWAVLAEGLRDAGSDPAVCDALKTFGSPDYVLDFGPGEDSPGRYVMPGFTGFSGQPGFELVDRVGDASLWRITACAT
jgi:hypothetical protein